MAGLLNRTLRWGVLASLVAGLAPALAHAGVGLSVVPSAPPAVTVGQAGQAASLAIANVSADGSGQTGYGDDTVQLASITYVPSCASTVVGTDCPADALDPGVLVPNPLTGTGQAGTACAGRTFSFVLADANQGKYALVPNAPVTLGPSSGPVAASRCVIAFALDVAKVPLDANLGAAGPQTGQKSGAAAVDTGVNNPGNTGSGAGTSQSTVRAQPTIATVASPAIALGGGTLTAAATVRGLANAVTGTSPGTVEFRLYGPGDATCATAIATRPGVALDVAHGVGTATSAPGYAPTAAGTYRWRALYSGDASNAPANGACDVAGASVVVAPAVVPPPAAAPPPPPAALSPTAAIAGSSVAAPARDRTATRVVLGGAGAVSPLRREVSTRITCPAVETGGCSGRAVFTLAFRNGVVPRQIRLGSATFALKPGASARVARKLSRAQYVRLREGRGRRLRVEATSRDAAGNVAKSARTSKLELFVLAPR